MDPAKFERLRELANERGEQIHQLLDEALARYLANP